MVTEVQRNGSCGTHIKKKKSRTIIIASFTGKHLTTTTEWHFSIYDENFTHSDLTLMEDRIIWSTQISTLAPHKLVTNLSRMRLKFMPMFSLLKQLKTAKQAEIWIQVLSMFCLFGFFFLQISSLKQSHHSSCTHPSQFLHAAASWDPSYHLVPLPAILGCAV